MAFLDHNGESEFPISKDLVFEAMCNVIPNIKGMKIKNADKLQGRIMVKAGVSLFSWGEDIPIQLIYINDNMTKVQITSSPKTGIMFGGAFDMGKNRKNIETILSETSRALSSKDTNQFSNITFQTKKKKSKTWLYVIGGILIFFMLIGILSPNDKKPDTAGEVSNTNTVKKDSVWKEVFTLKGNGSKKSKVFALNGNDCRLKYNYKGESSDMGAFAVYVVDEGVDIMKDGGFPDLDITSPKEISETSLQKPVGNYYLNINSVGNWAISIEQLE